MNTQQVKDVPAAACIVSVLGAIIGLFIGLAMLFEKNADGLYTTQINAYGLFITIDSILLFFFASRLIKNPEEHSLWGFLILITSIIGVATLLGLIGAILAFVYKPKVVSKTDKI